MALGGVGVKLGVGIVVAYTALVFSPAIANGENPSVDADRILKKYIK